jgi:aurora kinase
MPNVLHWGMVDPKHLQLPCSSPQVDAWAMGVLAYELLVGHPPFEHESRSETYQHIMNREPRYPSHMSSGARDFISLALCKVRGASSPRGVLPISWLSSH